MCRIDYYRPTVPVIAIFTKFDGLDATAYRELCDQGIPPAEAQARAAEHADAEFDKNCLPLMGRSVAATMVRFRSKLNPRDLTYY